MSVGIATGTPRPTWRGLIHRGAVTVFVPLFVLLAALASGAGDRLAVVVYGIGVCAMFGVSAAYHSGRFSPAATRVLKRIDHATILLAIAGSYTGVATLALTPDHARPLLVAVWVAAAIGGAIRMVWLDAPYPLVAVVYVVVGWIALIELPALADALSATELALVVGGGLLYTAGGVVYGLHRPNPWPATFGYHEVFHALTVAGAACHYLAVFSLVR